MTAQLAPLPQWRNWDNNGNPLFNGLLYTYAAGTTTPQASFTDSTQGTSNANPVVLNSRGEASIWLDPTLIYKLVLTDQSGNNLWSQDQVPGGYVPTAQIGSQVIPVLVATTNTPVLASYVRTATEIGSGITPTNYAFMPGDIRRYGGAADNGTTDNASAIRTAWLGNGTVYLPENNNGQAIFVKSQCVLADASHPFAVAILGQGMDRTTIVLSGSGQFVLGDSTYVTRASTVTFRDFTINGNRTSQLDAIRCFAMNWLNFDHIVIFQIWGSAIYAEGCFDCSISFCHINACGDNPALGGGHANRPALYLPFIATVENNHWNIIGNQFEGNYSNDILCTGITPTDVETDHFITKNKFGVSNYAPISDTDSLSFHVSATSCTDIRIVDNWFFSNGAVYINSCISTAIHNNHAREMSQGILEDVGCVNSQISGNHIEGNNITDGVSPPTFTGSLSANHNGIFTRASSSTIGPQNDCTKFWTDYNVFSGATNVNIVFPISSGAPCLLGSAGGGPVVSDGGSNTSVTQIDQQRTSLSLQNSWVSAGFATPSYSKHGNLVSLRGMIASGTITAGTVIAVLPAGFIPTDGIRFFSVYTDNGTTQAVGSVEVDITTGNIKVKSLVAGTTHVALDGVVFPVD